MYVISVGFLVWAWKKLQNGYSTSVTPMLAVSSAFVFAAQMINFPIFFGASGHLVGGTFLAILLGPYAAILSMTIVVLMQAVIFVDGGISTFGANLFNMAIIGGLSFFVVKALIGKSQSSTRFFASIFAASWISVMLGALACGLQIGFSPFFAQAGGIMATVPTILSWHVIIGLGEALITATLLTQLKRMSPSVLMGYKILGANPQ